MAGLRKNSKSCPVSNYSYPRPDSMPQMQQHHREQQMNRGRTSQGSDCSAASLPGMVDDHESDVSIEDDHTYHVTGAELWDSFWQANVEREFDASRKTTGLSGPESRYPALIPSPVAKNLHTSLAGTRLQQQDHSVQPAQIPSGAASQTTETLSWPLPPSHSRHQQQDQAIHRPRTPSMPKASYSLFPPRDSAPKAPTLPPRTSSLSRAGTPRYSGQPSQPLTASMPELGKRARRAAPAPVHVPSFSVSATLSAEPPTSTKSAPVTPLLPFPSPLIPAKPPSPDPPRPCSSRRRPSFTSLRRPSGSSKSMTHAPHLTQTQAMSYAEVQAEPPQGEDGANHSVSPTHDLLPLYQQDPAPPSQSTWCQTQPQPSPQRPHGQHHHPHKPQRQHHHQASHYSIGQSPPLPSQPQVSAFDFDSDTDSTISDEESRSLARRIVRGLQGHRRSASETRRSARGDDVAKAQLRRVRAGFSADSGSGSVDLCDLDAAAKEWPRLRRQGGDVLGRMLGRRSR